MFVNPINASTVEGALPSQETSYHTEEHTQERNPSAVGIAIRVLGNHRIARHMKEFTQERSLMLASTVTGVSAI